MYEPEIGPDEPGEHDFADALRSLQLVPLRVKPNDVWYRAGFDAGRKSGRRWQAAAAVAGLVAGIGFGLSPRLAQTPHGEYVQRPTPPPQVVVRPEPQPPNSAAPARSGDGLAYLRLRDALAYQGLEGLPAPPPYGDGGNVPTDQSGSTQSQRPVFPF